MQIAGMDFIKVDGKNTLEIRSVHSIYSKEDMEELAKTPHLPEEYEYYDELRESIISESLKIKEGQTRRFMVQNSECISTIHFLLNRNPSILSVYMRSSDVRKLPSDLSFLSQMALKYGAHEMNVNIGSLHIIL